jgi:pyruvate/2-oxoglutarate dehydrogenase complex dihydrolipoamide dehydrogenase (E3) component
MPTLATLNCFSTPTMNVKSFAVLALLGIFLLLAAWLTHRVRANQIYARWAHLKPKKFDRNLIVIGAGAGGLVSAYIAAAVKAKVTLVEAHKMGGDCLNYGCVPSKALIKSARLAHQMQHGARYGLSNSQPTFSFRTVMKRVRDVIAAIEPHDSIERYTSLGVDVLQGHAKIITPWAVEITLLDGSQQTLTTRAIVIATGARPMIPPFLATASGQESGYVTSDTLWDEFAKLKEVPKRMVVLGGGPIGCELAQSFARLGSQVIQIEMGSRLMAREDEEVSGLARAALQADGVRVLTDHKALRCEIMNVLPLQTEGQFSGFGDVHDGTDAPSMRNFEESAWASTFGGHLESLSQSGASPIGTEKILVLEHEGKEIRIAYDALVCAVGRVPRLAGFGLEELGIPTTRVDGGTIQTNEYLETIYPNIFAAGDVAGPYQFTHVAAHQAWYASVNALFGSVKRFKVDYAVIPWATFIDPEVARVGLNEQEATARGIAYEVTRYDMDELDRQICDEGADTKTHGFVKVLTVPGKDKILGVTIVGTHSGDLLAEYVLAMKHGLGLNKILGTIHTYPTLSEVNKYVAGEWKRAHQPVTLLTWVRRFHDWRRG